MAIIAYGPGIGKSEVDIAMTVFEKIEAQQKGKEDSPVWMVGEQLKEILRDQPELQEIVDKDLDNKDMSLEAAEKQIHGWADHHKGSGKCVCVPPQVAENVIREFYGLPGRPDTAPQTVEVRSTPTDTGDMINLMDFF